jgi:DNA polymerase II large subunit
LDFIHQSPSSKIHNVYKLSKAGHLVRFPVERHRRLLTPEVTSPLGERSNTDTKVNAVITSPEEVDVVNQVARAPDGGRRRPVEEWSTARASPSSRD